MSATDEFPSDSLPLELWRLGKLSRRRQRRWRFVSLGPRQVELCEASSSCRPTTFASSPSARPHRSARQSPSCSLPVHEGYDPVLPPQDHSWDIGFLGSLEW